MYAVFIHSTSLGTVSFKLFKFLCHLSSNTKYNCLDVLQVIIIFGLQQTSDKNSISNGY